MCDYLKKLPRAQRMHHEDIGNNTSVMCVFEGGGARGVAHIGTLAAIESIDSFKPVGFAGTSAGSIVAALAAAGWTADELYHRDGNNISSKALDEIGHAKTDSLADLFKEQWKRIVIIRGLLTGRFKNYAAAISYAALFFVIIWPYIYMVSLQSLIASKPEPMLFLRFLVYLGWITFLISTIWASFWINFAFNSFQGFASLSPTKAKIDKLLAAKVSVEDGKRVTFHDIHSTTGFELKIVAACLTTKRMELFDRHSTPSVAVADAVVASCAIPIVFYPEVINGKQYCDGGIVSNLPAWTFDDERILDSSSLVITSELSEVPFAALAPSGRAHVSKRPLHGLKLLKAMLDTAFFGASNLNTRGLFNHIRIPLNPSFDTLDFEAACKQVRAIGHAKEIAENKIRDYLFERESVHEVYLIAREILSQSAESALDLRVGLVRAVNLPCKEPSCFQIWSGCGFSRHPDMGLLLPKSGSFVGECVEFGRAGYFDLSDPETSRSYYSLESLLNGGALLPTDRKWIVILPLARRKDGVPPPHVSFAITIDSNLPAPLEGDELVKILSSIVNDVGVHKVC